jgi:hypothetical protein
MNLNTNFINQINFNIYNNMKNYDINYLVENGNIININQIKVYYPNIQIKFHNNKYFIIYNNSNFNLYDFYKNKIFNINLDFFLNFFTLINFNLKDCKLLIFVTINDDNKGIKILNKIYDNINNKDIGFCFNLTNNINIRKLLLFIKKKFNNYVIIKTINFNTEIQSLISSYQYINNKIKFNYILKLDTYNNFDNSIFIEYFDFVYYYFIFNDLLILSDDNYKYLELNTINYKFLKKKYKYKYLKKYCKKKNIFYSNFYICKKHIFDKNYSQLEDLFKFMFINPTYKYPNIYCLFFKINFFISSFMERKELIKINKINNKFPNIYTIVSCIIYNKKDIYNIFNIINTIKTKNNIIIIFSNNSKFDFQKLLNSKYSFLKLYNSNINNHLFNYLIGFNHIKTNCNYKLLFINNSYNFNLNKFIDFCLFDISNKNFINIYKKIYDEIYLWFIDYNFSITFFKNIEKYIIINYLASVKNLILFFITNNKTYYKNLFNIKKFFFNYILKNTNINTIFNQYYIKHILDIYKFEGNINNKHDNLLLKM